MAFVDSGRFNYMDTRYQKLLTEYEQVQKQLAETADPAKLKLLGKRQAELAPVAEKIQKYENLQQQLKENEKLTQEADAELLSVAQEEIETLKSEIANLKSEIDQALLPRDPLDEKDIIMEIRAAAGGDEAALFAAELYRMYQKFAEKQGFKISVISSARTTTGGFKEVTFEIAGADAYGQFKYESGVHRVQRVPETEKAGRVHTSTVTVAVLPEMAEVEMKLNPADLKIETSTARGHGGQSVNTTYSAIRITHLPTGIMAQSQDERSQQQNRQKAMRVLLARVFEQQQQKRQKELREKRLSQIGTGDRSEKIRTYNFPQDRVTDHRINQSWGQIDLIMEGEVDKIVQALREEDRKRMIVANDK